MDKQIHMKKVTVSKSRNIASFVLNIISTSFFGIATILFLASAFVIEWTKSPTDHFAYSSFGIKSDIANSGILFVTIGYLLFIWARALRSQHKIASAKLLTLSIITSTFLFLGAIFINVASPTSSSITTSGNTLDDYFAFSVIGILLLGTGLIMSVIFNHIFYKDSLAIIALPILIIVFQLISAVFCPWWNVVNNINSRLQKVVYELTECVAVILVWALIARLICGELTNGASIRNKVGSKLEKIFFGIFMGAFITWTVLSIGDLWIIDIPKPNSFIAPVEKAMEWLEFASGILFAGYLSGLTVSVSSGIYLNQASARSLG